MYRQVQYFDTIRLTQNNGNNERKQNARAQQVIIKTQKRLSSPSIKIQRTHNKNKYQIFNTPAIRNQ